MVGSCSTSVTVIVKLSVASPLVGSLSLPVRVMVCIPTSLLTGVPDSVAVPSLLAVNVSQPGRLGSFQIVAGLPSGSVSTMTSV